MGGAPLTSCCRPAPPTNSCTLGGGVIHPTFAAAMAQRMGLPSGRGSRRVSARCSFAQSEFAGSPGVLMNLPGLRRHARGSLGAARWLRAPAGVCSDGPDAGLIVFRHRQSVKYGRYRPIRAVALHSTPGARRRRAGYRASYIEEHDDMVTKYDAR